MTKNNQLLLFGILLIFTILLFTFTSYDELIQNNFFNFQTSHWIVEKHAQPYAFIFYSLPKIVIILTSLCFLTLLLFFHKNKKVKPYTKGLKIVILSTIIIPLLVSELKKVTNMPCPTNQINYGGIYPKTAVWEQYSDEFKDKKKMRCWPAGHASGGFALLSLFFLFHTRRNKFIGLAIGLGMGWSMGLYKMLIGDHFLSHTLITMLLSWIIILLLYKGVHYKKV